MYHNYYKNFNIFGKFPELIKSYYFVRKCMCKKKNNNNNDKKHFICIYKYVFTKVQMLKKKSLRIKKYILIYFVFKVL